LGIGGYPKGRIIEIYGSESTGKTTLALQAIAQAQIKGEKCVYIDLENALDKKFCELNGVDTSSLLIIQPNTAEETFDVLESLIKTKMIGLIIVDSVAAMVPKVETEGDMEDQTIGLHARIMSKGLRIIQNLLINNKTTIIFINQIREKVGIMFGNPEVTTGGRALKFYASVRIELRKKELLKKEKEVIGVLVGAKVVKNKVSSPMTEALINIYFNAGIDHTAEIIDFALEKGLITKKGSWFFLNEERIAQGYDKAKEFILNNAEVYLKLREEVLK
ncbi:MAG: recombinase RecA, partial [Mycoplasmataceae bacterium]|nr:recombinase RecA [Mycoplasmataceae bacterium]